MGHSNEHTTGKQRVLTMLTAAAGNWISSSDLYAQTRCMVHSRIADLRREGHWIEHSLRGGEHGYRLVP